jgi:single-stranded-DNA-specific exonuclease
LSAHTRWKIKSPSPDASRLAQDAGLTPLQAHLLFHRNISSFGEAKEFLNPRLTHMADPMLLEDMEAAVARICHAIQNQEKIVVYGDYDADGLTAAALLVNFFSELGIPVSTYIPHRLREGYGLNRSSVQRLAGAGTDLLITVDCGVSDTAEITLAHQLGMEVVVTDHHRVPEAFQARWPVVNPHRVECPSTFQPLSGVGLAFYLAVAIRGALRRRNWFGSRPEPDLRDYLDLVALGTVADRVSLLGQNRMLVKAGLEVMARSRWPGVRAMLDVADISGRAVTSEDTGFRLAPRLNAPGRIGDPGPGIRILTSKESEQAQELAREINQSNGERQRLERVILDQIKERIRVMGGVGDHRSLLMAGEDWHPGVLGIVASRLVDEHLRPALVVNVKDGVATGSGRSTRGFNLHGALSRLGHILNRWGGHAHAAGFTMKSENLPTLQRELEEIARDAISEEFLTPTLEVDAEVRLDDITGDMLEQVQALAPFGEGNPEPLLFAEPVHVSMSRVVGGQHLKLLVRQGERNFEAIGFGMAKHHPLSGETIRMVFTPERNRWQGVERIQLRIADLVLEDSRGEVDVLRTEDEQGCVSPR